MKETSRMLVSSFAAAIVFLLLFLFFHWNLIVCILLCVGIYFGLFFLLKPSRKIAGIDVESMPGGEEIRQLLDDAQADLADIDKAVKEIKTSSVRQDAQALYATGARILAYLEENPDTVCIASGGQGEDEPMSEAECIRDHLVAGGIDADRILLEDRSTSTEENLRYSLPMLRSPETDVESVGIVTNDFHVFRALCLARKNGGFTFYGVPARSTVFGFIHYAMREFFTLSVSLVRGYI